MTDDYTLAMRECQAAMADSREISDAAARVIASMFHTGQTSLGYSFASTGAVEDPSKVWRDLFDEYSQLPHSDQVLADMLGTYLTSAGNRGPVPGWSGLWLSNSDPVLIPDNGFCDNCGRHQADRGDWSVVIDWRTDYLCPACVASYDWADWSHAGNVYRHK